jgi:hypothetical protein
VDYCEPDGEHHNGAEYECRDLPQNLLLSLERTRLDAINGLWTPLINDIKGLQTMYEERYVKYKQAGP